jgi:hypothetical protein
MPSREELDKIFEQVKQIRSMSDDVMSSLSPYVKEGEDETESTEEEPDVEEEETEEPMMNSEPPAEGEPKKKDRVSVIIGVLGKHKK